MKAFYDCEFLDQGTTIPLISIGMVTEDDRIYHAVNADAPWKSIYRNPWLMANVWPHLPLTGYDPDAFDPHRREGISPDGTGRGVLDYTDPRVKPRQVIADEVREFLQAIPDLELWSWYADYDHVVLCQLWGTMVDLPPGIPMWTGDLHQEAVRLGVTTLPQRRDVAHDSLADAFFHRDIHHHLEKHR